MLQTLLVFAQEAAQSSGGVGVVEVGGGIGTLGFLALLTDKIVRAIKSRNGSGGESAKNDSSITKDELREHLRSEREAEERERAENDFRVRVMELLKDIKSSIRTYEEMRKDLQSARADRDVVYKEYYKILASLVPKLESLSDLEDKLRGGGGSV